MKNVITILLLALLMIALPLKAQEITHYDSDNSDLYYNSLYCIDFDQDDNIWFGGQASASTGLARVCRLSSDYTTWTVFEPADLALTNLEERVFYMAQDDQGTMWFCTHYGVSFRKADGTAGELDFTKDKYTRTVETDSRGTIYISDRDAAGIWVSEDHGENWVTWTGADIGMTLGRPEIYDLREDSQGQLWICTWYGVVYRNTEGTWVNITETEDLYTYCMTIDKDDHKWVPISGNKDLYEIMPDGSVTVHDSTTIPVLIHPINDIEADAEGMLWLATDGGGLIRLDPSDGTYTQWDSASTGGQIPENNLTHMEFNNGVIWVSTATEGILRVDGALPEEMPEIDAELYDSDNSDLYYNSVYCIDFDQDDNIWFGGQASASTGLARVCRLSSDYTTWTVFEPADLALTNLEERVFYMAQDDQGTMWFCTHYGVSFRKADGTAGELDFTKDKYTRTVETDSKGTIYISDRDAAGIWVSEDHGENWVTWTGADIGMTLGRPEIYDLREDSQGQLWICTWYGVVYRNTEGTWVNVTETEDLYTYCMTIDKDDHKWVPISGNKDLYEIMPDGSVTVHDSTTIPVLIHPINDIEADAEGMLWLATDGGGLIRLDPSDGTYTQWDSASTGGQIPENNLTHMEFNNGVIWVSTATEGILRIDGAIPTAINDPNENPPVITQFRLHENYPNPFNPSTTIRFELEKAGDIQLSVYDLNGRRIKTLLQGTFPAGTFSVSWNGMSDVGTEVASGVYMYNLTAGGQQMTRKMILIR